MCKGSSIRDIKVIDGDEGCREASSNGVVIRMRTEKASRTCFRALSVIGCTAIKSYEAAIPGVSVSAWVCGVQGCVMQQVR